MRFFSKFVFICNVCFLLSAVFHYLKWYINDSKFPQPLNAVKGTVVILAEFGWILNFFFIAIWLGLTLAKKKPAVAKWLIVFNAVCLLFQIYYFFIDRT